MIFRYLAKNAQDGSLVVALSVCFWSRQPLNTFAMNFSTQFVPQNFSHLNDQFATVAMFAFVQKITLIANPHLIIVKRLLGGGW